MSTHVTRISKRTSLCSHILSTVAFASIFGQIGQMGGQIKQITFNMQFLRWRSRKEHRYTIFYVKALTLGLTQIIYSEREKTSN